jgi:hypothetical protein
MMKTFTLSDETARLILDDEIDVYDVLTDREPRIKPGEDVLIQEIYDEVAMDNGLHPDDDFEEIIEIMMEQIAADYGN